MYQIRYDKYIRTGTFWEYKQLNDQHLACFFEKDMNYSYHSHYDYYRILSIEEIHAKIKFNIVKKIHYDDLKKGMHIKYIKNMYDYEADKFIEKVCNGGFLIEIENGDKIIDLKLVVKTNIVWKLRFIKYTIYAKDPDDFYRESIEVKNTAYEENKEAIEKRKKELHQQMEIKLNNIKKNKDKYKIIFKDDTSSSDESSESEDSDY
jgi:hypothetical protein